MQAFVSALIPILIIVGAGIIALLINERFAPDPLVAKIVQWVIYIHDDRHGHHAAVAVHPLTTR